MQLKITFDGTDISTSQQTPNTESYSISTNLSGQLDNFNTAQFEVYKSGYFAGKTPADLQWKRVIIEDLSLPLPIIDTFNRTNGNFTGATATPDIGPTWSVIASPASNAQVVSNQLQLTSGGQVSQNLYAINSVINVTFVSGTSPAVVVRASGNSAPTDGFVLYSNGGTTYLKLVASPFTTLASADGANAGDVFKISLSDTSLTVTRNGIQLFGVVSTSYTANTYVALLSNYGGASGNHIYDNFSATYLNESISKRIFSGYSDAAQQKLLNNGLQIGFEISCKDSAVVLGQKNTYKTYTNQSDGYIIKDLLSTYFGTLFDTSLVGNFGSMPYFASNYEDVLTAIKRICQINGTQLSVDNDDRVRYSATFASSLAPFKINETGTASLTATNRTAGITNFSKDLSGLLTKVTVIGAVETKTFTGESITDNPHYLGTLVPTISQFKYTNYNYPVFWTYSNNNINSPVDGIAINSTNAAAANHAMLLVEYRNDNGYGGFDYVQTYSSLSMQAGEMQICVETPTGFEVQKYNFEEDIGYGITVDYSGHATVNRYGSGYGKGVCYLLILSMYGTQSQTYYYIAPRLFWIGHGWPCVVSQTNGAAVYTTATINTTMLLGSTPGTPAAWANALTVPFIPPIVPTLTYPHAISYSGPVPIKAIATIDSLRDTYGPIYDGGSSHLYFEKTIKDPNITNTANAKERARIELIDRASGITNGAFKSMWAQGLSCGMLCDINSPTWGASGLYLINKLNISGLGATNAMYDVSFGDYKPEILDFYLKLNKQKDDSQFGADDRTTQTVTQNYTSTTSQYYNNPTTIYNNSGVLLS